MPAAGCNTADISAIIGGERLGTKAANRNAASAKHIKGGVVFVALVRDFVGGEKRGVTVYGDVGALAVIFGQGDFSGLSADIALGVTVAVVCVLCGSRGTAGVADGVTAVIVGMLGFTHRTAGVTVGIAVM